MNRHLAKRAFSGRRILVCVCGGVAAYKAADLVSGLAQSGAEVRVAMTPEATRLPSPRSRLARGAVGPARRQRPLRGAAGGLMLERRAPHRALRWAEVVLAVPATANLVHKLAHGLADEVVSTTLLATGAPVLLAPAMHDRMWGQPATQENLRLIHERGVLMAGPVEGRLASGDRHGPARGPRRYPAGAARRPSRRSRHGRAERGRQPPAGPASTSTRCATSATDRAGAWAAPSPRSLRRAVLRSHLVTTSPPPDPAGVMVRRVVSAAEMLAAVREEAAGADLLIMAAAVADFRPARATRPSWPRTRWPGT